MWIEEERQDDDAESWSASEELEQHGEHYGETSDWARRGFGSWTLEVACANAQRW